MPTDTAAEVRLTERTYGNGWRLTWSASQLLLEELPAVVTAVGDERRRLRQLHITAPASTGTLLAPQVIALAPATLVAAAKLEARDDYLKASRRIKAAWVAVLDRFDAEASIAPLRERRLFFRRVAPRGFDEPRVFEREGYTLIAAWHRMEAMQPDGAGHFVAASEAATRRLYVGLMRGTVQLPSSYRGLLDLLRELRVPVRPASVDARTSPLCRTQS